MKKYKIRMTGDFTFDVMVESKFLWFKYWGLVKRFHLYVSAVKYLEGIGVEEWK